MNTFAFIIGSICYLLIGVGHTALYLTHRGRAGKGRAISLLKNTHVTILGDRTTLFSLYEGYSLMMGGLLVAFGVLNLMVIYIFSGGLSELRPIIVFDVVVAAASVLMFRKYAFFLPVALSGLATLGYLLALFN